jgi:outer membrane protein assembly factor BamE (lipoprotein component of BamABCDE complex)
MKRTPFKNIILLAGAALLAAQVAACTPRIENRGNFLSKGQIAQLNPEGALRADVQRVWGPPSAVSPFDEKTWYYIGEVTSQKGIFATEVEQRQVVKVTFDTDEAVSEIALIDPKDAQNIDYVSRRTPTAGREFTAFQQFVGNLGRFNQNIDNKRGPNLPTK